MKNGEMLDFKNGWSIYIHDIKNGEVYFQKWPPGVGNQLIINNLRRMPVNDFEKQVTEERQKEIAA